jgi:hypothetical protein
LSPGTSRYFPDAMAPAPPWRRPAVAPCVPPHSRSAAASLGGTPLRPADAVGGERAGPWSQTRPRLAGPALHPRPALRPRPRRPRRVGAAVLAVAPLAMFHAWPYRPLGHASALALSRQEAARPRGEARQPLANARLGGGGGGRRLCPPIARPVAACSMARHREGRAPFIVQQTSSTGHGSPSWGRRRRRRCASSGPHCRPPGRPAAWDTGMPRAQRSAWTSRSRRVTREASQTPWLMIAPGPRGGW